MSPGPVESLFFQPTTGVEVGNIVRKLKVSSPGWDGISSKVVKAAYNSFLNPLVHVLNLSLSQGLVPEELKTARLIPIFKSGTKSLISNYRPISILPCFSKILEKLVYTRIVHFITRHNLLHPSQFGFREHRNTSLALIQTIDYIAQSFQANHTAIGVFIDFRKAFDCVSHQVLCRKIHRYGIRGLPLQWITDYLSDRYQFTMYNDHSSQKTHISCGVPQGSILGPLLFLLHINDLPHASNILSCCLYADDANFFTRHHNIDTLTTTLNNEMKKIMRWTSANKLTINTEKTHYLIFTLKFTIYRLLLCISLNNAALEEKDHTKFLGVIIDNRLKYKDHLHYLKPKVAKTIGIINKVEYKLPQPTLHNLYYTFIYPHLTYGIEIWGSCPASYSDPLYKLQKKALRIITHSHPHAHSRELFIHLKVLPLQDIYLQAVMIFMFKITNHLYPHDLFQNMFHLTHERHPYQTRHASNMYYIPPFVRTNTVKRTIRSRGPYIWNLLHDSLPITTSSISIFKAHLRSLLCQSPLTIRFFSTQ